MKTCANCKASFTIDPEDFDFYEKLRVPSPTWCPDCRSMRRLMWRNERILYRRTCDAPGHSETIIAAFPKDVPHPVYDQEFWWSDGWDALQYGREYDFSRPFFEQFKELLSSVPLPNVSNLQAVRSDYCNFTYQSKNCYLVFASNLNEDSAYLSHAEKCRRSYDLLACGNDDQCYECIDTHNSFGSAYLYSSSDCINSKFLYNCHNCQNCFGCVNLKNAKFHIWNQPYSKEEYEKKVAELESERYSSHEKIAVQFYAFTLQFPRRFATLLKTVKSSGDYLNNTKNATYCFDCQGPIEDAKYLMLGVPNAKDCYDGYGVGEHAEQVYESTAAGDSAQLVLFSCVALTGRAYQYCYLCRSSSDLFGCVGVKSKNYCILNKQYSKEEYLTLMPKIIQHMKDMPYKDAQGRVYSYGEYFPGDISPFSYNETIAQEFFSLTKEEAEGKGYRWSDQEAKKYEITITPGEVPDRASDAQSSFTEHVIGCAHEGRCSHQCTTAFRILPEELSFYVNMKVPLPRLCPNCRHFARLARRNPFKLWKRTCDCSGKAAVQKIYKNTALHFHGEERCINEFETTYSADRPETVYCEQCYQAEVA